MIRKTQQKRGTEKPADVLVRSRVERRSAAGWYEDSARSRDGSINDETGGRLQPRSRDVKSTFVWRRLAEICESERDANELSEAPIREQH